MLITYPKTEKLVVLLYSLVKLSFLKRKYIKNAVYSFTED